MTSIRLNHSHWFLLVAGLITLGALWLRVDQIDRRPFHADEGVQGYQTWRLLRGHGYTYDPADKHGPFLYYFSAALIRLTGGSAETLTDSRLRGITLIAGLATILVILLNARTIGPVSSLLAILLIASAPLTILYDTYYVQEAWFCFFTWALVFGVGKFMARPSLVLGAFIGFCAGLMQATKETSVIHFAALGIAWLACKPAKSAHITRQHNAPSEDQDKKPAPWPAAFLACGVFVFTYLFFYSSFFTNWTGVQDGLRAYIHYASRSTETSQSQPWNYYISMLWSHHQGGVPWGEPLLLLAALIGCVAACRASTPAVIRLVAVFSITLLLLYTLIPYKMPWLLLTPYIGLCLLAAHACLSLSQAHRPFIIRIAAATVALLLVAFNFRQTGLATDRYANDSRNPYLFLPTSADLTRLINTLQTTRESNSLAVVSEDHAWPLPWYLRDRKNTGYFSKPPENLPAYELALLDSRLDLKTPPSAKAFGLRPDVLLWLNRQHP